MSKEDPKDGLCDCGAPASEPEPCPFAEDIRGDDTPCDCCDDCRHQCAMDI